MTAEEKLKILYDLEGRVLKGDPESLDIDITAIGGVHLSAWDIDLIANLVVERLRNDG